MDLCRIALGNVLSYLISFLDINKRTQPHQQVSAQLLDAPTPSYTGSRQDVRVQTDLPQVDIGSLQAALERKDGEVRDLKKKEQRAVQRAQSFQAELEAAYNRGLKESEGDRIALRQRVQQTETRLSKAEDRVKALEGTIGQLSRELRQSQDGLEQTTALLDTRSAELNDAQAYLSKLDDVADSDVLQLVSGINSRIFQATSNIANAFQPRYDEQKGEQVSEEAAVRLQGLLSDDVLLALRSLHHTDDPLVVQIALQAATASHSKWLCTTWDFQIGPCLLQDIYRSVRESERQSIAGRWRALSRTHVKMFLKADTHRQRVAGELVDYITDILLASGVGTLRQDLRREVEQSHGNALHEIAHQSLEFQCIAGERIISRDLSVVTVVPGNPFDRAIMVDEWPADPKKAGHSADPHPVLCTTQLGLVREEKAAIGGVGGEERIVQVVLLKPKVVLTSLVEELWNEQERVPCKT